MPVDDRQLESWKEEQHIVAASTFIPNHCAFTRDQCHHVVSEKYRKRYKHCEVDPRFFADNKSLLLGGVDVAFPKDSSERAIAVYVILKYVNFETAPEVVYRTHQTFVPPPYISSYLSFRESPPLLSLIEQQMQHHPHFRPHVIMVDGNGVWHERRAGLACFIGKCGIPCIGVGKTWYSFNGRCVNVRRAVEQSVKEWNCLFGGQIESSISTYCNCVILDSSPFTDMDSLAMSNEAVGASESLDDILSKLYLASNCLGLALPLFDKTDLESEILAYALIGHGGHTMNSKQRLGKSKKRFRGSKNPIYISVGNNITLGDAVSLVAYACGVSRIPEPVREADSYGRSLLHSTKLESIVE